jgi:hypothetical protein
MLIMAQTNNLSFEPLALSGRMAVIQPKSLILRMEHDNTYRSEISR